MSALCQAPSKNVDIRNTLATYAVVCQFNLENEEAPLEEGCAVVLKTLPYLHLSVFDREPFRCGPALLLRKREYPNDFRKLGELEDVTIAYGIGDRVEILRYDSRLLERTTRRNFSSLLQSFADDSVNLSTCDVNSYVRTRCGFHIQVPQYSPRKYDGGSSMTYSNLRSPLIILDNAKRDDDHVHVAGFVDDTHIVTVLVHKEAICQELVSTFPVQAHESNIVMQC